MYCSRMPSLLSFFLSFHHVYYHDVELQEICLTFCQITFGSHGKQCGISDIQVGEDLMTLQNERGRWVGELVRLSQNYLTEVGTTIQTGWCDAKTGLSLLRAEITVTSVPYFLSRADIPLTPLSFVTARLGLACLGRGICSYIDAFFLCTYFLST